MTVKNEILPIEINGAKPKDGDPKLVVESHWNRTNAVHLKFADVDVLVSSKHLMKAIANAENHD